MNTIEEQLTSALHRRDAELTVHDELDAVLNDDHIVRFTPHRANPVELPRLLAVAAAVIALSVAGLIRVVALRDTASVAPPAASTSGSDTLTWSPTRPAAVTWYVPETASTAAPWPQSLLCRSIDDQGRCAALTGTRAVIYRTTPGQIDVITEYGADESINWQILQSSGSPVDLGGRDGLMIPGNDELVGFQVTPDIRVVVIGEAGTDTVTAASELTTRTETLDLPVVFGEALASTQELPRDGGGALYYAGYLDTTGDRTCVGGIGVPWNNTPSCVPVEPNTLTVTVASPSPTGTILIATLPVHTTRAVATVDDGPGHELAITDASQDGYKLTFADLDASVPRELIAYDAAGVEVGRTTIISTGGAPLGYLPTDAAG